MNSQEKPKKQEPQKVKVDTVVVAERRVDSVYLEQKAVASKLDSLIREQKAKKRL